MRLVRLRLSDFLPYQHVDLDLDGLGQLAIVGPNGAGKSSLLDAVLWSVYGQARGRADQLIREGESRMMVESTWAHPVDGTVVIKRTRSAQTETSSLTLTVNGVNRTQHTIADTQTVIDDLVGLPYRALVAGPVMVQDESGALMEAAPAERKEILVKLFELDRYEQYHLEAKTRAIAADVVADEARRIIARLHQTVDEELTVRSLRRDAVDAIARARTEVAEADQKVIVLREEAVSLRERAGRADDVRRLLDSANKQLDRATATLSELDAQTVEYRERVKLTVVNPSPDSVFQRLDRLEQATRAFLVASDKAHIIDTVPCGAVGEFAACPFLVDATKAVAVLPRLEEEVLELGGPQSVEAIKTERQELHRQEKAIAVERERHTTAQRWLEKEPAIRHSLEEQIDLANVQARDSKRVLAEMAGDIARAQVVARDLNEAVQTLVRAQGFLEVSLTRQAEADARLRAIATAKEELADAIKVEQEAEAGANLYRTLTRAFGRDGIPTLILENGIPLIEDRANEVLARMPGGFAVNLVTQRETKAGTIRDTLDVLVVVGGRERPYLLLSGGERLRVDFAIRVALADVLVRRKGRAFSTLWIDEGFGSQDRQGREAMVEAIAAVADDFELIVVVSHVEDVTDRFDTRLIVAKDDEGISSVEVR